MQKGGFWDIYFNAQSDYLIELPYITAYRKYSSSEEMEMDYSKKNIGYIFANDKLDPSRNRDTFSDFTKVEVLDSTNGFYLYKLTDNF